jgi:hypothetical protein
VENKEKIAKLVLYCGLLCATNNTFKGMIYTDIITKIEREALDDIDGDRYSILLSAARRIVDDRIFNQMINSMNQNPISFDLSKTTKITDSNLKDLVSAYNSIMTIAGITATENAQKSILLVAYASSEVYGMINNGLLSEYFDKMQKSELILNAIIDIYYEAIKNNTPESVAAMQMYSLVSKSEL